MHGPVILALMTVSTVWTADRSYRRIRPRLKTTDDVDGARFVHRIAQLYTTRFAELRRARAQCRVRSRQLEQLRLARVGGESARSGSVHPFGVQAYRGNEAGNETQLGAIGSTEEAMRGP